MNRFSFDPEDEDLRGSDETLLEEEGPVAHLLSALSFAQCELSPGPGAQTDPELLRDDEATAAEIGCSVFTAMVINLLTPLDRPDYAVMYYEGSINGPLTLDTLPRDVLQAYAALTTRDGEWIERGLMQREAGEWCYRVREPSDPRLQDAVAFTIAIGPPHVNA